MPATFNWTIHILQIKEACHVLSKQPFHISKYNFRIVQDICKPANHWRVACLTSRRDGCPRNKNGRPNHNVHVSLCNCFFKCKESWPIQSYSNDSNAWTRNAYTPTRAWGGSQPYTPTLWKIWIGLHVRIFHSKCMWSALSDHSYSAERGI